MGLLYDSQSPQKSPWSHCHLWTGNLRSTPAHSQIRSTTLKTTGFSQTGSLSWLISWTLKNPMCSIESLTPAALRGSFTFQTLKMPRIVLVGEIRFPGTRFMQQWPTLTIIIRLPTTEVIILTRDDQVSKKIKQYCSCFLDAEVHIIINWDKKEFFSLKS